MVTFSFVLDTKPQNLLENGGLIRRLQESDLYAAVIRKSKLISDRN